jgi:hypothetical protein
MIKLLDLLNEDENKDEPKQDIETFNRVIPVFPNFAKQIKRDNPKIIIDPRAAIPFTTTKGRLDLNSISGIKYDMGGEDLEEQYSPDKNIFEINEPWTDEKDLERNEKLKKLGFGGLIVADLSKPHIFPKANGINITNTITYFYKQARIVAKTIDNSLNSGGLLLIWDHFAQIEDMSPVLSSYKIIAVHPLYLEDIGEFEMVNKDGFDGDHILVVYRK